MFRWLELVTGGVLIPLVAILIALFTGWCLTRSLSFSILGKTPWLFSRIWYWVMRLVLPVVVAYIGISYALFSLDNLCDNNAEAVEWCGQMEPVVAGPEDSGDDAAGPAPVAGEEAPVPAAGEGEAQPTRNEEDAGPASQPEKAPKQGEILYHSV